MNESGFLSKLEALVGKKHLLTQEHDIKPYRKGFREGFASTCGGFTHYLATAVLRIARMR